MQEIFGKTLSDEAIVNKFDGCTVEEGKTRGHLTTGWSRANCNISVE